MNITCDIITFQISINRNIVECKLRITCYPDHIAHCINRNIVECKYVRLISDHLDNLVLIETLWNINYVIVAYGLVPFSVVLIETLWNVNLIARAIWLLLSSRINRNIVECKSCYKLVIINKLLLY